ncbi:MAG: hypothetical protein ACLR43_09580 [Faecalibacillus faecis]
MVQQFVVPFISEIDYDNGRNNRVKENNHVLTKEQIYFIINGYCNNKILIIK